LAPDSGRHDPGELLEALEKSAGQAEWTPLFTDNFERTSLGDDWRMVGGQARIINGWMRITSNRGNDVYASVRRPFPDNIRLEFDARFPADLDYICDLACFVAGDEHECDNVGYCLSFAADGNTCSRIQREGVDIRINLEAIAEAGRSYHLVAEMVEGHLTLSVDGKQILNYLDMIPLAGAGHDHLGLVTFKHGAEFSNFRVLTHSGPTRTGTFTVADAYCRDGLYDRAIEKYRQIAAAHPDQLMGLLAQCKVGLALMSDARWSEAEAQLRGLSGPSKGTEIEHLVSLWRGRALGMMGKIDDALKAFGRVQESTEDSGIIDEVAVACGLLSEHLRADRRWLESGLCAKFLFEKLKTPLIETSHMFGRYGNRLRDAGLLEEEYQAVTKVGLAIADVAGDPSQLRNAKRRRARLAAITGRVEKAERIVGELEEEARASGDRIQELTLIAARAEFSLAAGDYQAALERVKPFAGTEEEEKALQDSSWGNTLADLHACASVLLGNMDQALDDLDAGRISSGCTDLRMILAAELWRRDRKSAAGACLAEVEQAHGPRTRDFITLATSAMRGEALVEALLEMVETNLQPVQQPRGYFFAGLVLWAHGNDGGATLPWSDAKNYALERSPVWHWVNYFQGRLQT
jgi:tetratricopeptide (TPR) repeat protein